MVGSERLSNLFHLEAFDDVALLDVLVALECNAAVEAFLHFASVVLESLQTAHLSAPDHGIFSHQADRARSPDHALDHHASSNVAGLRDAEDLTDLRLTECLLDQAW